MTLFWELIVVLTGISGGIFNVYKKKICFVIWTLHQIAWIVLAIGNQSYVVIGSPLFFIGLNIYGYRKWKKDEVKENEYK